VVELAGLPVKSDVSDWLAADHTVDELNALVESTPLWTANSVGTEPSRLQEPEVESEEASQRPEVIASGRQLRRQRGAVKRRLRATATDVRIHGAHPVLVGERR
jgi:hypothetical protein